MDHGANTELHARSVSPGISLHDLLSNTLVLEQITPYLPVSALLALAATSKEFRGHLLSTCGIFRHLDLTRVKKAYFEIDGIDHGGEVWRNVQLDENLTEDDFYSGPLRGIFYNLRRHNILQDVHTLVLDGLSITAELVNDILVDPRFNVRILSIREARNLNERKLMQSLRYACRASRADNTPKLKGLYIFGKQDVPALLSAHTSSSSTPSSSGLDIGIGWNHKSSLALKQAINADGDDWYHKKGRVINKPIGDGWAETLLDCREMIHFDAVLCTGPRHQNSPAYGKVNLPPATGTHAWAVATFALSGCASCGCAPEGFTVYGDSPKEQIPVLAPVPLHSSSIKAATAPQVLSDSEVEKPKFVPRCWECIRERYCFSCDKWWCENCYTIPTREELMAHLHIVDHEANGLSDHEAAALTQLKLKTRKIARECWECENNCLECIAYTQRRCKACGGGYCIVHYEGSTSTLCDWCSTRGRRIRYLY